MNVLRMAKAGITEMALQLLTCYRMRGMMGSTVVEQEMAELARELGLTMEHMVKIAVKKGINEWVKLSI